MTTAAQVRKLVKPLMQRHPEFALVGRMIVIPPVRHILRAIYVDRTREAIRPNPRWLAMHLFEPVQSVWFNLGGDIYKPRPTSWSKSFPTLWWIEDPLTPDLLVEAVEKHVLPKLEPLGEMAPYVRYMASVANHAYDERPYQKVIVEAALGRLEYARAMCRDVIAMLPVDMFGTDERDRDLVQRPRQLCGRLAANDRAGLVALLHEWEAITVRNLNLDHLWEPTPFPLETQVTES